MHFFSISMKKKKNKLFILICIVSGFGIVNEFLYEIKRSLNQKVIKIVKSVHEQRNISKTMNRMSRRWFDCPVRIATAVVHGLDFPTKPYTVVLRRHSFVASVMSSQSCRNSWNFSANFHANVNIDWFCP